jgi:tol-pal system protein YbgF
MGLKNLFGNHSGLRYSWFVIIVLFAFLLIGCGSSDEATMEEPSQAQATNPTVASDKEKPKDEQPMDQALTSFVGSDTEKPTEPIQVNTPVVAPPTQLAQYEKQIEDLRIENTGLKQKIVKLEQENRDTNTRMGELEAKYAVEKMRADKADELSANIAIAPKTVAVRPVRVVEEPAVSVSTETYDNSLKAFKARRYDSAVKGFKAIVDGGANDDLAKRATYWLGESYFAMKKYKEALPLFQETLNLKNSEKKADAQFMIAQTYERLGSKVKAKAAYEKVVKNYPMSKNVKRAKERWAKL